MEKSKAEGYFYLASPYSAMDEATKTRRFVSAAKAAAFLMTVEKKIVFSPIAHTHPISRWTGGEMKHEEWMRQDEPFLRGAAGIIVLKIEGWESSKGVQEEIALAKKLGIPITYMDSKG